jgi:hypothetical protein
MTMPNITARFSIGEAAAMITKAVFIRPEPPMPATALPMMSIVDDCAAPQIALPTENAKRNAMNTS